MAANDPKAKTDVAGGVADETANLEQQLAALKTDVANLTAALARYGAERAHSAAAHARESVRTARARGSDQLAAASEYVGERIGESEDYIRANPGTSLAIAAGLGLLVGLVMARR